MSAKATGRMGYAAGVTRRRVTVRSTDPVHQQVAVFQELSRAGESEIVTHLSYCFTRMEEWLKAQGFDPQSGSRKTTRPNARRIDLESGDVPAEYKRHREAYRFCSYVRPLLNVLDPKPTVAPPSDRSNQRNRGKQEALSVGSVELGAPPNRTLALWVAEQAFLTGRAWQGLQDILVLSPEEREVGEDFAALVEEIARSRAAGKKMPRKEWFTVMQNIQRKKGRKDLMTLKQLTSNLHKYRQKPGFEILRTRV
jgi:hypothetical protein